MAIGAAVARAEQQALHGRPAEGVAEEICSRAIDGRNGFAVPVNLQDQVLVASGKRLRRVELDADDPSGLFELCQDAVPARLQDQLLFNGLQVRVEMFCLKARPVGLQVPGFARLIQHRGIGRRPVLRIRRHLRSGRIMAVLDLVEPDAGAAVMDHAGLAKSNGHVTVIAAEFVAGQGLQKRERLSRKKIDHAQADARLRFPVDVEQDGVFRGRRRPDPVDHTGATDIGEYEAVALFAEE
jgi:hypothetical protein